MLEGVAGPRSLARPTGRGNPATFNPGLDIAHFVSDEPSDPDKGNAPATASPSLKELFCHAKNFGDF